VSTVCTIIHGTAVGTEASGHGATRENPTTQSPSTVDRISTAVIWNGGGFGHESPSTVRRSPGYPAAEEPAWGDRAACERCGVRLRFRIPVLLPSDLPRET